MTRLTPERSWRLRVRPRVPFRPSFGEAARDGRLKSRGRGRIDGCGNLYRSVTIPYFRNFSVGIPPHLQNGDVFPSLTSVRHPVGDVAHDKSTVGAASWSRTAARWYAQPRLVQGRQRESL